MKPLRKILLASLGVLPFFAPVDVANAEVKAGDADEMMSSAKDLPWRKARFSIETQTGTRSIATADAFVPFLGNDDFMVYADIMAKTGTGMYNSNGNAFEGNIGLGVRRVNDAETAIYGAYAFYDMLRSVNNNQFKQVTVGVERLGLVWDFRANAYIPFGTTSYTNYDYNGGTIEIDGHDLIEYIKSAKEFAQSGGDVEVGRIIGSDKLRAYLAAYSFGSDLTGPRLRFEYQLNQHISLNAATQYDKARGSQYFIGARFSVGGAQTSAKNSIYARMTDPVVRDVDVVTVNDVQDASIIEANKYFEVDKTAAPGGSGTAQDPYADIVEAIQNAPENALIVVRGSGDKDYDLKGAHLQLKPGQRLTSTAADVDYKGMLLVKSDGADARPNLWNGSIELADNTMLQQFGFFKGKLEANSVSADPAAVIVVNGKQNVLISDVHVVGFENSTALQVTDSEVSLANFEAKNNHIGLVQSGGQVTSHTTLDLSGNDRGAVISGSTAQLTVDGELNVSNSKIGSGLEMNGGLAKVTSVTATDAAQTGVLINNAVLEVTGDITTNGAKTGNGVAATDSLINVNNLFANGATQNGVTLYATDLFAKGDISASGNQLNGFSLDGVSVVTAKSLTATGNVSGLGLLINDSSVTASSASAEVSTVMLSDALDVHDNKNGALQINHGTVFAASVDATGVDEKHTAIQLMNNSILTSVNAIDASGATLRALDISNSQVIVEKAGINAMGAKDIAISLTQNSQLTAAGNVDVSSEGSARGLFVSGSSVTLLAGDLTANVGDIAIELVNEAERRSALEVSGALNLKSEFASAFVSQGADAHVAALTVEGSHHTAVELKDSSLDVETNTVISAVNKGYGVVIDKGSLTSTDITITDIRGDEGKDTANSGAIKLINQATLGAVGRIDVSDIAGSGAVLDDSKLSARSLDVKDTQTTGLSLSNKGQLKIDGDVTVNGVTAGSGIVASTGSAINVAGSLTVSDAFADGISLNNSTLNAATLYALSSGANGFSLNNKSIVKIEGNLTVDGATAGSGIVATAGSLIDVTGSLKVSNAAGGDGINLNKSTLNLCPLSLFWFQRSCRL